MDRLAHRRRERNEVCSPSTQGGIVDYSAADAKIFRAFILYLQWEWIDEPAAGAKKIVFSPYTQGGIPD